MVKLLEISLGEATEDILICPVYEDFTLETSPTRDFKILLEESIDFSRHRREVRRHVEEAGNFYRYHFSQSPFSFQSVYYLNIRTFLRKLSFFHLASAMSQIFLDILEKDGTKFSVALPLLGLDYFSPETELKIFADVIQRTFLVDPRIHDLKTTICLGHDVPLRRVEKGLFSRNFSPVSESRPSARRVSVKV